jgi:hypothetical protein
MPRIRPCQGANPPAQTPLPPVRLRAQIDRVGDGAH